MDLMIEKGIKTRGNGLGWSGNFYDYMGIF